MGFNQIQLADTGLKSARLGLGTAYGIKAKDIIWAFENGINYIFWGSIRRSSVPKAIKALGTANRDKLIIAAASYGHKIIKQPQIVRFALERALKRLKIDYLDIFQISWITQKPNDKMIELLLNYKDKGFFKHLAFSTHNRPLAAKLLEDSNFKFAMVRYNAANRGAETEIFPYVDPQKQIIVSFNSTRWGQLLKAPKGWPKDKPVPKAADCLRFVLTHPKVTICLTGAKNRKELEENVKALELGPLSEDELSWIKDFGDFVYKKKHPYQEKL